MAELPRDSYRPVPSSQTRAPRTPPPRTLEADPPPLRFGEGPGPRDALNEDRERWSRYAPPRASRWRRVRGPAILAVACAGLIVVAWSAWTPVLEAVADGAATLAAREGDGRAQPTASVALAAVAALGFVVAWWRATHPRRAVRLSDDRGTMPVDAVAGELRASVAEVDGVREAEVSVENRGRGRVRVRAWLRISPEARIDDVLDGVDEAADRLVTHRLGLLLSEPPLAEVRYDELDLRAARSQSPARHRQEDTWPPHPDDEDDEDA